MGATTRIINCTEQQQYTIEKLDFNMFKSCLKSRHALEERNRLKLTI